MKNILFALPALRKIKAPWCITHHLLRDGVSILAFWHELIKTGQVNSILDVSMGAVGLISVSEADRTLDVIKYNYVWTGLYDRKVAKELLTLIEQMKKAINRS